MMRTHTQKKSQVKVQKKTPLVGLGLGFLACCMAGGGLLVATSVQAQSIVMQDSGNTSAHTVILATADDAGNGDVSIPDNDTSGVVDGGRDLGDAQQENVGDSQKKLRESTELSGNKDSVKQKDDNAAQADTDLKDDAGNGDVSIPDNYTSDVGDGRRDMDDAQQDNVGDSQKKLRESTEQSGAKDIVKPKDDNAAQADTDLKDDAAEGDNTNYIFPGDIDE